MAQYKIVGILNTTPDSYVDGGHFVDIDAAILRAGQMLQEGADIVEIGGESTGPNSKDVSLEEERKRTIPFIEAIHGHYPNAFLSVDTTKSAVAKEAIEAGVQMVNDVSAGRNDPEMFAVIASAKVPYVLMYSKDATPRTTVQTTQYDDVVATIKTFFEERIAAAKAAGIQDSQIILDPGLGHFVSSDPQYSFEILARLEEFSSFGYPIFLSPSRKSFLAGKEELPVVDRLPGTIAASALALLNGAAFIRTHDVLQLKRACDIAETVRSFRT